MISTICANLRNLRIKILREAGHDFPTTSKHPDCKKPCYSTSVPEASNTKDSSLICANLRNLRIEILREAGHDFPITSKHPDCKLERAIATYMIVAWRLMYMAYKARIDPDASAIENARPSNSPSRSMNYNAHSNTSFTPKRWPRSAN